MHNLAKKFSLCSKKFVVKITSITENWNWFLPNSYDHHLLSMIVPFGTIIQIDFCQTGTIIIWPEPNGTIIRFDFCHIGTIHIAMYAFGSGQTYDRTNLAEINSFGRNQMFWPELLVPVKLVFGRYQTFSPELLGTCHGIFYNDDGVGKIYGKI